MSYHSLALIQNPLCQPSADDKHQSSTNEEFQVETHDETIFDNPQFKHYEETSNIQLFFDLFFVANLTSFTNAHEINSGKTLSSYVGFFCILWFTWCQVTLYDVRFSTDSVYERIAHACHFGVMVGLAVAGPQFNDPQKLTDWNTLQQLSFLLMASRIVLFFQYGSTLYFAWKYRTTRLPLVGVMASLAVAAIIYLGLSFAFSSESSQNAYLAWYVVSVFEVGANIAIAGRWPVVSFKGTHLVERMTCLTLIILGEGVIGLCKSITKIENLDFSFSRGAIGTIIASVLVIYFVYMNYFDNVQLDHFGIIRQQIWTFLHFPFHVALVLLMEGTNQFVSWRHIIEYINTVFTPLQNVSNSTTPAELYDIWNSTIETVLDGPFTVTQDVWDEVQEQLALLSPSSNATDDEMDQATNNILTQLFKSIFNGYNFEPPTVNETANANVDDVLNSYYNVFALVFEYFFICAGLVLISISVLSWLSLLKGEGREARHRWIGIIANFLLGLGLTLLSTMVLTDAADLLGQSVWTIPLLVFVLLISLILNHVPAQMFSRKVKG